MFIPSDSRPIIKEYLISSHARTRYEFYPDYNFLLHVIGPLEGEIRVYNKFKDNTATIIVSEITSTGVIYANNNCNIRIDGPVLSEGSIETEKNCNVFMNGKYFKGNLKQALHCTFQVTKNDCDVSGKIVQNFSSSFIANANRVRMYNISISQSDNSILRIENNGSLMIFDNSSICQYTASRFQVNGILEVGVGNHLTQKTAIKQSDHCTFEINNASVEIKNSSFIQQSMNCIFTVKNSSKLAIFNKSRVIQSFYCTFKIHGSKVNIAARKSHEYSFIGQKDYCKFEIIGENSNLEITRMSRITQKGDCCNFKIGENSNLKMTESSSITQEGNSCHFTIGENSNLKMTESSSITQEGNSFHFTIGENSNLKMTESSSITQEGNSCHFTIGENSNLKMTQSSTIIQKGSDLNFKIGENFREIKENGISNIFTSSLFNFTSKDDHFVLKRFNDTYCVLEEFLKNENGYFVLKMVNDTYCELGVGRDFNLKITDNDRPKTLLTDSLIDKLQTLAEGVAEYVLD